MSKDNNIIQGLIGESSEEKRLKYYLHRMYKICGDDYTSLILSCDVDIKRSLAKFTSKLHRISSDSAKIILLKGAILSNRRSDETEVVKYMIEDNKAGRLFQLVDKDMFFRKNLTRILALQGNSKNITLFNSKKSEEDKRRTIELLSILYDYEKLMIQKDFFIPTQRMKQKKRGNN